MDLGIYEGRSSAPGSASCSRPRAATFGDLVHPDYADDRASRPAPGGRLGRDHAPAARAPPRRDQLGIEPDDLDVALAVRMSMSIPVFFEPVRYENPKTEDTHLIWTAACSRTTRSGCSTARRRPAGLADLRACCSSSRHPKVPVGPDGLRRR